MSDHDHDPECNVWEGCQQCDGPDLTRTCTCHQHDDDVKRMEAEGGPPSPEDDADLNDFTAAMEGRELVDEGAYSAPNPENISWIQRNVSGLVNLMGQQRASVIHLEVLIALGNVFLDAAETAMAASDLPTYDMNRESILQIVGIQSAHLNNLRPTEAQLAAASTSLTVN